MYENDSKCEHVNNQLNVNLNKNDSDICNVNDVRNVANINRTSHLDSTLNSDVQVYSVCEQTNIQLIEMTNEIDLSTNVLNDGQSSQVEPVYSPILFDSDSNCEQSNMQPISIPTYGDYKE